MVLFARHNLMVFHFSFGRLRTWLDFLWIATTDRFLLFWRFHPRIILMTQHTILSFLAWSTYFLLNQWRQIGDENWLCPCNTGVLLGAFTLRNYYSFCAYFKHYFVWIMRCRPTSWITTKIKTTFMLCVFKFVNLFGASVISLVGSVFKFGLTLPR